MTDKNTKISDESLVIKKYKPLIDKLIPMQQQNRLLESLNKFSGKLSSRVRTIIKNEVIRLTALTDASADNSEFARFPVMKFKHFGIDMRLDKVGKEILERETGRFLDRYTVGVYESVMNSEHYQSLIKQEQQEKIAEAFSVESQSFNDLDFADDLAIHPNFVVTCAEFDKGKKCPVTSMNYKGMIIETKRAPVIEGEPETFAFVLPPVSGFSNNSVTIRFIYHESVFNKVSLAFESRLTFADSVSRKVKAAWQKYIQNVVHQFPLQRDLEIERVLQDLERDRILNHSPWIPVFITNTDYAVTADLELRLTTNQAYNDGFSAADDLPGGDGFKRLVKELETHQETFLLTGNLKGKESVTPVASTHRELAKLKLLKQFVQLATESDQLKVIQCRLFAIDEMHKQTAYDIHDIIPNDYPLLERVTHILFCKNVSNWAENLTIAEPEPFRPFPRPIIKQAPEQPPIPILENESDRRSEPRFAVEMDAQVKTGFFSGYPATLNDISTHGLKVTVSKPQDAQIEKTVKVSVEALMLSGQKYQVVYFDKESGSLHLKLPEENKAADAEKLNRVFSDNVEYFKTRDLSTRQKNRFRFLWELCIRNLPCDAVLITNNRFTIDRLKTVYNRPGSYDLYPFENMGTQVLLHGFLADKDASKPRSGVLDNLLKTAEQNAYVVHAVKHKDKKIVYIELDEFLHGKTRKLITEHVLKGTAEACVTHLCAITCSRPETPMTKKRLALLSKIDINAHQNFLSMQKGYTHVLHITNVSCFHNVLLRFGIAPRHPQDPGDGKVDTASTKD
ncbi:PilZ domain-containing protein [Alteromonas sp. ASW11-36]|uniref:PilZ domain-containing protein n=1 Tax=Alteromonas arenosi TaxID=3055817 RepID=A0ABT7ST19_9ALTE|nr:PilZ domain-containing protein [Alteromonas sp. ASW11-36]MDM7859295.1 PilZ domain-containing protein [Alteromonas sp. ASW11-36]